MNRSVVYIINKANSGKMNKAMRGIHWQTQTEAFLEQIYFDKINATHGEHRKQIEERFSCETSVGKRWLKIYHDSYCDYNSYVIGMAFKKEDCTTVIDYLYNSIIGLRGIGKKNVLNNFSKENGIVEISFGDIVCGVGLGEGQYAIAIPFRIELIQGSDSLCQK